MKGDNSFSRKLLYILYNLAAVILLFLLSEFAVRIFIPEIKPLGTARRLMKDSVYLSSSGLLPNSSGLSNGVEFNTDEYGFRKSSVAVDTSKPSWLFLGDSVTMGIGVDDDSTFCARLNSTHRSVNVLNPSLVGYDITDYRNLYEYFTTQKKGLKIERIYICWSLNDIYAGEVEQIEEPAGALRKNFNWILNSLRDKSSLYQFLKKNFTDRPEVYYKFDEQYYSYNNRSLRNSIEILRNIASDAKNKNLSLYIVLLPYEFEIRNKMGDNSHPKKLMKEFAAAMGIQVIDPAQNLIQDKSEKYYLYGDGIHFSNEGHRQIARYLSKY